MPLTLYINVVSIENILKSWLSFCLDQQLEAASAPELHESRVVKRTLMGAGDPKSREEKETYFLSTTVKVSNKREKLVLGSRIEIKWVLFFNFVSLH